MYGHQPHHGNRGQHQGTYGHKPYSPMPHTSGVGPMRGGTSLVQTSGGKGPWPTSTGLSLDGVKTWLGESSRGVQHKWWALGIGVLTVGALAYHGKKARWF